MTDREQLQNCAEALGSRASCLCRDACGDWHILGRKGHVYVFDAAAFLPFAPRAENAPKST
jgi:hypothetical protein